MSWTLAVATRTAMAQAFADRLDAGATAGKLRIYSGTRPSSADAPVTDQTLLAEITLLDPAFAPATNGQITLNTNTTVQAFAVADGTATWARLVNSDGTTVGDCKVSAPGGSGDLILDTVAISTGLRITIASGTLTMPTGTAD